MPKGMSEKERFIERYHNIVDFHRVCPSYDPEDCTLVEDIEAFFDCYDLDTRQDWFEEGE